MDRLTVSSKVLVLTGYMDCQLHRQTYEGLIIGRAGRRYLVRDNQGRVEYLEPHELLRYPTEKGA